MGKTTKSASLIWTLVGVGFLGLWIWCQARRGEFSELRVTLLSLNTRWLEGALVLQAVFVFWQTMLYWCLYRLQGYTIPFTRLYLLVLISTCVGRLIPLGTAASLVAFIGTARKEGAPELVSAAVSGLYYLLDYAFFGVFIIFSLGYIGLTHVVSTKTYLPLVIMLFFLVTGFFALGSLLRNPGGLERTVKGVCGAVNRISVRFTRKAWVDTEASVKRCSGIASNFTMLRKKPRLMLTAFWSAFLITFTDILTVYFIFRSLGQRPSLGLIVSGFTLGTVISFLTFVPNGMGIYVVSLWSVFMVMGVSSTIASTVSLVYRFITYWVPAVAGLCAWVIYCKYSRKKEQ